MNSPIKILFLAANPMDTINLRIDEEIRGIRLSLRQTKHRDNFDIQQEWAVRVRDLEGHLLHHQPDIVHFSGHGSSANGIILGNYPGDSHPVSADTLSNLFLVLKSNIRCVVLNSCYSEVQAYAIAKHIDCVIGMSKAIEDTAAISFAVAFYQALGYGKDVKAAFDLGCLQIHLEGLNEQDVPRLLSFNSNPSEVVFVRKPFSTIKNAITKFISSKLSKKHEEAKTRWFWYLSPRKLTQLSVPQNGWGFLTEVKNSPALVVGAPWAKLSSSSNVKSHLIKSIENIEREIRQQYNVLPADRINPGKAPLFFEFSGKAGRLVLRESYKNENTGESIFILAGLHDKTGVLLLGSGSHILGANSAKPRFIDPSFDPVGALIDLLERQAGALGQYNYYSRVGKRQVDRLGLKNLHECTLYSFASALMESQMRSSLNRVRSLAVFAAQVNVEGRKEIANVYLPNIDSVVVGSPIYVEQMEETVTDIS